MERFRIFRKHHSATTNVPDAPTAFPNAFPNDPNKKKGSDGATRFAAQFLLRGPSGSCGQERGRWENQRRPNQTKEVLDTNLLKKAPTCSLRIRRGL